MSTRSLHPSRSATTSLFAFLVALAAFAVAAPSARAQAANASAKKIMTVPDYGLWRTISGDQISSDGHWVTYTYRFTNVATRDEKPELHILNVGTNQDTAIPNATNGAFSPDGRWISFQVDSEAPRGRGGRGGAGGGAAPGGAVPAGAPPAGAPPGSAAPGGRGGASRDSTFHRVELRELASGKTQTWRDMQSVVFSQNSKYALVRNRAGAAGGRGGRGGFGRGGGGSAQPGKVGSDAILYDLTNGRTIFLGSVGDAEFNRAGTMLAYTVNADVRDANGLFVIDLANGSTRSLDNASRIYGHMTWNDAGTGLAVLKGTEVPKMRERATELLVVPNVDASAGQTFPTLNASAAGFPAGWVISDRAPLAWSADGARVFFGAMPQTPDADTVTVHSSDSTTDVDIWRTGDRYIQSAQMGRASQDRNFSYREAFEVASGKYVGLSDSTMRDLELSTDGSWAVGRDARAYISDWKPAAADFYRVNLATGERTLMFKNQLTQGATNGITPDSRAFVYWKDGKFQAYNPATGTSTTLGVGAPSFVDTSYDHPGTKPSWGVAGFTSDGERVIVNDKYDLWTLPLDGKGKATNITGGFGAAHKTILRLARLQPIDPMASRAERTGSVYDLSQPVTLSAFGDLTKQAGFYTLSGGNVSEVVYDNASYSTPAKAAHADKYLFARQTFVQSPDLRVSGPDFKSAAQITISNPQQAEYKWGHDSVFTFTDKHGHKVQGLLWIPDDYKAGEKRPMLVNFYEKNSQLLNVYPTPELLVSMGRPAIEAVSRGYIVMIPDIYYNTGSSHDDQLDCVEAATRKVIALGYADPKHIGLHGHSYAGEGSAYIGTKSRLFAAVGEGAGVTDLYTDFSQEWGWSYQVSGSGENGNQYYIYGQGRWGFSPWQRPDVYHDESALTHVPEVTQPFLIMHGTADPTVSFIESENFYNALRFNGKNAILLAYPDAGHHVAKLGNRTDLTIRFFQFFDHYLQGAPAADWMTHEMPYLTKSQRSKPGGDGKQ